MLDTPYLGIAHLTTIPALNGGGAGAVTLPVVLTATAAASNSCLARASATVLSAVRAPGNVRRGYAKGAVAAAVAQAE